MRSKAWLVRGGVAGLGLALAGFVGCGGLTAQDDTTGGAGSAGSGGAAGAGGHGGQAFGGMKVDYDAGIDAPRTPMDAFSEYVDPGCPDAPMKMLQMACDPMGIGNGGCPAGLACYPYVESSGDACGSESFGTSCSPEGTGKQGDACDDGCSPGFLCVVSGQGTQCVKLCDLSAAMGCSGGLLCTPVDIPGIGGCL